MLELVSIMVTAFVLISTIPEKFDEVYDELLKVPGVVELKPLLSGTELLAKVEVEDFSSLAEVVIDRIRGIPGVLDVRVRK